MTDRKDSRSWTGLEIAIVGMAGRFPGARDVDEFWDNLARGVESIRAFTDEELTASGVAPEMLRHPDYVKARGVLEGTDLFDADFFGYNPREAEVTDPQHRLFLECAWSALEDAGYNPRRFPGLIGTYGGAKMSTYLFNVIAHPEVMEYLGPYQINLGNDKDFLASRVAYKLDLRGPGIVVQTACSTSMVAVHTACQALLGGECDMALAGGVSLSFPARNGYLYQENGILSRDGRCRPFDAAATGSVPGEGVGVVVLKRLDSALEDGDAIYAVIRGTGVNNDGISRAGFTAPGVRGQAKAIDIAQLMAEVDPETITYVETHGTATKVGDPIEIAALKRVFQAKTEKRGFCALGSVKSNIGHLDTAAGIAGLIKTVLALRHRKIPPTLHFERPNPELGLDESPFYVARELSDWPAGPGPRRAGVSSFGLGGTNAHAILEEAPARSSAGAPSLPWQLLPLSARSENALETLSDRFREHLETHSELELADVAWTLQSGRMAFDRRRFLLAADGGEAGRILAERDPVRLLSGSPVAEKPSVVFAFPGLGDQYLGMGRGLYGSVGGFRAEIDRAAELLAPELELDLRELLYPRGDEPDAAPQASKGPDLRKMLGRDDGAKDAAAERLNQTRVAQPVLFVLEYALARFWMSLGIEPSAMIGYSLGEYVAACLAGVMSLEDALRLVAERSRLIAELPSGAMLAVPLSEAEVEPHVGDGLWVAAINGPEVCVVAGEEAKVRELEARLVERELLCRRLATTHAFHTEMMRPIAERFRAVIAEVELRAPEIPYLSNVTGTWIEPEEATDPDYWVRHLVQAVRFGDGVAEVWREPGRILLEVGPGQTLGSLALQMPAEAGSTDRRVFATLPHGYDPQSDLQLALTTLGRLWLSGLEPEWSALHGEGRRLRVHLPTYPFERRRYWLEASKGLSLPVAQPASAARDEAESAPPAETPEDTAGVVVDRHHERPALGNAYVAPRDEVEGRIVEALEELLGIMPIGVYDNFFELGGHSLAGARLFARLRKDFDVEMPLEYLFETPTAEGLAQRLRSAVGEAEAAEPEGPELELRPVSRDRDLPLSFSQERLWFLDQMVPGSSAYNIRFAARLKGRLDVPSLVSSISEIVARQESLRTTFRNVSGRPLQYVAEAYSQVLPVVDLRNLPHEERDPLARSLAIAESRRPFDLLHGPLLRVTLLRLGEHEHIIVAIMHHVISDGWSMHVFFYELAMIYEAFSNRRPCPLPPHPIQYADYAYWQRRWFDEEKLRGILDYWREQLAGAPRVLDLPTDRPRQAVQSFEGGLVNCVYPGDLLAELSALARRRGSTLFMVLLAAFQAFLGRYCSQNDVVVGSPIAGRTDVETENLIGFFVNMLVLRSNLAGAPDFFELLEQVRGVTLGAYAHQALPFEKLVEELHADRDLSHSPIFQVVFVLQNVPMKSLRFPGFELEVVKIFNDTTKFDLTVQVDEFGDVEHEGDAELSGLYNIVEFNKQLFDATTVRRLMSHYQTLLEEIVEHPDRPLATLSLLRPSERVQMLVEWNDRAIDYPQMPMAHELFAEHARRRPEAPALVWDGGRLDYGPLEERANRLAHHLRSAGVGPEVLVALCVDRMTPERVIGIVAVLKAGGAYVSIDPTHPRDRVAFLMEDAGAAVVLTEERFAEQLPPLEAEVICLDSDWDDVVGEASVPPAVVVTPENLAYVVYTSGSTGKPKGVAIPHAGLMNLVHWHQREYSVTSEDRGTQVASPAFDASIWELWPYLAAGASLAIPDDEIRLSSPGMIRWWAEQGITLAYLMTPLAEGVLDEKIPPGLDLRVRALIIGGDRLHRRPDPGVGFRLMNHYGPAEYSVTCTVGEVPPVAPRDDRAPAVETEAIPTIGHTIDNTEIYLFDRGMLPVPIGVSGELYVGGIGLARGYLGRPGLTAERFVPHVSSKVPGERLYKTGDLVRWLTDGEMDFLGRIDHQVKLRGLRIELGEIEAAFEAHPEIKDVAVLLWEAPPSTESRAAAPKQLTAYLVAVGDQPDVETLKAFLRERLPAYMVPTAFVFLDALPLSPNGKVDRQALPAPSAVLEIEYTAPSTPIEERVAGLWSEVLAVERIGVDENFFDAGGHSLLMVRLQHRLREEFGLVLPIVDLFQHPTVETLSAYLESRLEGSAGPLALETRAAKRSQALVRRPADIAVIGMAGRFPGASSLDELWRNLAGGVESIARFTDDELLAAGVNPELLRHPSYVKASGALDGADLFDAEFFGYSPREAQVIDPQHRLFLETSWQALEDAGYGDAAGRGAVGVFAGTSLSSYLVNLYSNPQLLASLGGIQIITSNDKDQLSTRVSYKLDLKGPSLSVQTACSTSMVAVHMACQSLMVGECDMALAGGVTVRVPLKQGYLHHNEGIVSPDGHCRAFDARSGGTVGGDGVGAVVLKRLEDAVDDGDSIYAVIKGSAMNNDGSSKVGFTAPSVSGESAVIAEAHEMADVDPETIGYVEAHGTGTRLGDPIEVGALTQAFRRRTAKKQFCAIGSIKTNFGHLDSASGVAGFIKTVLAVQHAQVPPSLHFETANPEIDFDDSPVYVNTELSPWPVAAGPRRAGVSSFGIGGTNVHAVLEEAPAAGPSPPCRPWQLLVLSARSEEALERATANLAEHLAEHPELGLADVAHTLQSGRRAFDHRRVVVARDREEAVEALAKVDREHVLDARSGPERPQVAFLFPGLGEHYPGMGRELYDAEPVFREALDECARLLKPELASDLRELLWPASTTETETPGPGLDLRAMLGRGDEGQLEGPLARTRFAQPALFAIEYALARLWMSWGITPTAMLGYSLGEYVAACVAGVFSLADALKLVARRARMIDGLPAGAMLAVPLSERQIEARLGGELSLAAVNGPELSVLSGPPEAIERCERELAEEGIACRRIQTTHAFHSHMMESIAELLGELVRSIGLSPPRIPYLSNVTGEIVQVSEVTDPEYWVTHLCRPVRFADGVAELWKDRRRVLLEVGPGQSLGSLALQHPAVGESAARLTLPSLGGRFDRRSDVRVALRSLGRLWLAGSNVDWSGLAGGVRRRRVHLPTYPFERRRYWVDSGETLARASSKRQPLEQWTYLPRWREGLPAALLETKDLAGRWLVFADDTGLGEALCERLRAVGATVVTVVRGESFARTSAEAFRLDPRSAADYRSLFETLEDEGARPSRIVYAWTVTETELAYEEASELSFYGLFHLAQGLARVDEGRAESERLELAVVTSAAYTLGGEARVDPTGAMAVGVVKVWPRESPNVDARLVDLPPVETADARHLADQLLEELAIEAEDDLVALRDARRWRRFFERIPLPAADARPRFLKEGATYLLTGGLGGLGRILARYLAERTRANLVLLTRSALPERETWRGLLDRGEEGPVAERVRTVLELEAMGSEILVLAAEMSDRRALEDAVSEARSRFGRIDGVFHVAGIPGGGLIRFRDREALSQVMGVKADGARLLTEIFRDEELDFLVLYSSLDALTGGFGQVDYTAANAYLGSLASSGALGERTIIQTVDWDGWQEVGMGARAEERYQVRFLGDGIRPEEAGALFDRLFDRPLPQIAVSTIDLPERIAASRAQREGEILQDLAEELPVAAEAHPRPALHVPYQEPRDPVESSLAEFWQHLLGIEQVGVHDNFFELGGHSLLAIQVVSHVQKTHGLEVPVRLVFEAPTVAELAQRLRGELESSGIGAIPSVLVPMQPEGDREPLFFVHPAGGFVLGYEGLARELGGERPFYGLQARGVASDDEPLARVEAMAETYLEAIRVVQPEGPYHLGGWSFGGVIAFEMARQLEAAGERTAILLVGDITSPGEHHRRREGFSNEAEILAFFARENGLEITEAELLALDPQARVPHVVSKAVGKGLLPDRGGEQFIERFLKVFQASYEAGCIYDPSALDPGLYAGEITLIRTEEGSGEEHNEEARALGPDYGWGRYTCRNVRVVEVPGAHMTAIHPPHLGALAEVLNDLLEPSELERPVFSAESAE